MRLEGTTGCSPLWHCGRMSANLTLELLPACP